MSNLETCSYLNRGKPVLVKIQRFLLEQPCLLFQTRLWVVLLPYILCAVVHGRKFKGEMVEKKRWKILNGNISLFYFFPFFFRVFVETGVTLEQRLSVLLSEMKLFPERKQNKNRKKLKTQNRDLCFKKEEKKILGGGYAKLYGRVKKIPCKCKGGSFLLKEKCF